jgi:hypothetical protein
MAHFVHIVDQIGQKTLKRFGMAGAARVGYYAHDNTAPGDSRSMST